MLFRTISWSAGFAAKYIQYQHTQSPTQPTLFVKKKKDKLAVSQI